MNYIPKYIPLFPEYRFGERPLDEYITIHAGRVPEKPAFNYYGTEITYAQLDRYVDQMATLLNHLGVRQGDCVGIFTQNCPQFTIAFFAAQRIGAVACPFSPMFKEWDLEFEINELQSKVIVCNSYLYPIVKNVVDKTTLRHVVVTDLKWFLPEEPAIPFTLPYQEAEDLDGAIPMMETIRTLTPRVPPVERDLEDVGLILFTSGTTGLPKGAMLTLNNALYKSASGAQFFYMHEHTRMLQTQPMCHIAGMSFLNAALYCGCTTTILAHASPVSICTAIDRFCLDFWYSTSLLTKMVLDWPEIGGYNLAHMRTVTTSGFGIPTTQELADEWAAASHGGILYETAFGMTETHTCDVLMPREKVKMGTNGIAPYQDSQFKIVENGKECAVGETGEILLNNKGIFKGYLNRPDATAEVLQDGWLHTGDAGMVDEEGYLTFLGRRKEMIKSSGFSVFPDEVEMYLCRHEAIAKAAVIGKPDEHRGELIKAFVILEPDWKGRVTEEEIIEWCKDKMATYKRPREVEFRSEFPMTNTGKTLRRELKKEEEETAGAH